MGGISIGGAFGLVLLGIMGPIEGMTMTMIGGAMGGLGGNSAIMSEKIKEDINELEKKV